MSGAEESELLVRLDEAAAVVGARLDETPRVGLVLGSGLGAFADRLERPVRIPYDQIPHLPRPSVVGHAGELCAGRIGVVPVACLRGRVHGYEGHSPERVVFGVRLLARLGCSTVLLSNAAGGIATGLRPGSLVLLVDHLNLTGLSPLTGPNEAALGPRFPDLTEAYDRDVAEAARRAARSLGEALTEGVYAGLPGPAYETPAEVRMLRTLGADVVGMSTVHEVIALRHLDVRVGGMSCVTNLAAGLGGGTLDHAEVEAVASAARERFAALIGAWIRELGGGAA